MAKCLPHEKIKKHLYAAMGKEKYNRFKMFDLYMELINSDDLVTKFKPMTTGHFTRCIDDWAKNEGLLIKIGRGKKAEYMVRIHDESNEKEYLKGLRFEGLIKKKLDFSGWKNYYNWGSDHTWFR